jgi:drug/metabolite transporter (DMT)-like permease
MMASHPMPRLALGIAAAFAASALFDLAVALQALEARVVSADLSLRPALLVRLARKPRWLGATFLGILGWPFQVTALLFAPLTVVQPALAVGLLLLLVLGARMLNEPIGSREILGTAAIIAGVAGMTVAAPAHTSEHVTGVPLLAGLSVLALLALSPYLSRGSETSKSLLAVLGAGCAYGLSGFTSKLLADDLLAGAALSVGLWLAVTVAVAGLGLLSEMSALQRRPATQVAPLVFVAQVVIPVALAPLLGGESWTSTPLHGAFLAVMLGVVALGAAALGRSPAVSTLVGSAAHERSDRRRS